MRREVVERALPFPEVPGEQYHDHWLGLVAMTLGDVAYVDRPLYDYVQHGGAALGHAAANAGIGGHGPAAASGSGSPTGAAASPPAGRAPTSAATCRLEVLAEALLGALRRGRRGASAPPCAASPRADRSRAGDRLARSCARCGG